MIRNLAHQRLIKPQKAARNLTYGTLTDKVSK